MRLPVLLGSDGGRALRNQCSDDGVRRATALWVSVSHFAPLAPQQLSGSRGCRLCVESQPLGLNLDFSRTN
jgi:hypothetical protein